MEENSLPISGATIGYILTGIVVFFLLMSAIVGYKRGLKKSLFRLIWVSVTVGILFFVTPLISKWLNEFDLSSYGLNVFGEVNKLSDIGVNIFANVGMQEYLDNSPALLDLAQNVSVAILNIVLFVLLFWLTKWILGIPYAIISSKVFDKDKKQMKAYKKKVSELKRKGVDINETTEETPLLLTHTNKYRAVGMLFGLVLGLIICASTFFPIIGINSIFQNVYASVTTTNEEDEEVPYLSTMIDDDSKALINSYEDSIASKIMKYSGMEFMSNLIFDSMSKVEVNGQGVYISNEVEVGVKVYKKAMEIEKVVTDMENSTEETLGIALSQMKDIFTLIEKSALLNVLGDDLLPYLIEKEFINNEEIKIGVGDEDYTQMLKDAYNNYKESNVVNVKNLKNQVESFLDIAILFNKNGLVLPLLNQDIGENFEENFSILTTNIVNPAKFSQDFVNYLYNITMIKYKYPDFVDSFLGMAFEQAGIVGFESNVDAISQNTLKNSLANIIENIINIIKSYNDSVDFDFGTEQKTMDTLGYFGEILDTFKDELLSEVSYTNLVDFLEDKVLEGTSEFADLTSIINEFKNITSWKTELKSLAPLYNVIIKINNNNENVDGVAYENVFNFDNILEEEFEQLYDIGVALQRVIDGEGSRLISNKNIRNILSILLDTVTESEDSASFIEDVLVDGVSVKNMLLNNIWNLSTETSSIQNWADELKYSINIARVINTTLADFDTARISAEENTELAELGKAIDDAIANTNLFVSNKVLRAYVEYFLNQNLSEDSLPQEVKDILQMEYDAGATLSTVKDEIYKNIYNPLSQVPNTWKWEDEFSLLKAIFATDFEGETDSEMYASVGGVLDTLAHSNIFKRGIIKQIVLHYIDTQTTDLDAELNVEGGAVDTIRNIISADETYNSEEGIEYAIKYADELTYLLDLVETATATYAPSGPDSAERVKFTAIGYELNSLFVVTGDVITEYKSKLLTQTVINQFIAHYIKSFEVPTDVTNYLELNDIIQDIPGENNVNLVGITNYALEFELLLDTVDMLKNYSVSLSEIGTTLSGVRQANSHFITDAVIDELVLLFFNSKVDVGWSDASDIVDAIKANITQKEINADENEYITMFTELSSLKDYFTVLSGITTKEQMESANVGEKLDAIRAMTIAGDKYVARDLSVIIIDKVKDYIGDESVGAGQEYQDGVDLVEEILVNDTYEFYTFDVVGLNFQGSQTASTYYSSLFTDILAITIV